MTLGIARRDATEKSYRTAETAPVGEAAPEKRGGSVTALSTPASSEPTARPTRESAWNARTIAAHDPMAAAFRRRLELAPLETQASAPASTVATSPTGLTAPESNLARGDTGPEVKQLQDALVALEHTTAGAMATGPGIFGPKTEAAVRSFQAESGLPQTGRYDDATRDALGRRLAGEPAPTPPPTGENGLPTSAADANAHFVTQFTSAYNPTGPGASANCGPASVSMALSATGRMPAGLTQEQEVDYARALMNPRVTPSSYVDVNGQRIPQLNTDSAYSSVGQVETAFAGAGGTASTQRGWEALDAALANGQPVVAHGHYSQKGWGATLEAAGRDLGYTGARAGRGDVGHFNSILGKTEDGRYIVADPMYTGGTVELTREQLAQFFSPHGGTPHFTALD